jgi:hypothetical protein
MDTANPNPARKGRSSVRRSARRTPVRLQAAGGALWADITGVYGLRVDELRVLKDACRIADVLTELEAAMVGKPLLSKGQHGSGRAQPPVGRAAYAPDHAGDAAAPAQAARGPVGGG